MLTPEAVGVHASMSHSPQSIVGLTRDVDTSLVKAAENLCKPCKSLHAHIYTSVKFFFVALNIGDKTGLVKK